MPRMALSGVENANITNSRSAPPPMRTNSKGNYLTGTLLPEQAEALAKVAALSTTCGSAGGPSRAMTTMGIAMAVLVVAMLLLAAVVSMGPSPAA